MIVADTDVLIDALRGKGEASRVAQEISTGRLATTTITVFELLSGARNDTERAAIERLLAVLTPIAIDVAAAREAAAIERELGAAGNGLATADTLIAGACRARSAQLLTRNRKHFSRVPGLALA